MGFAVIRCRKCGRNHASNVPSGKYRCRCGKIIRIIGTTEQKQKAEHRIKRRDCIRYCRSNICGQLTSKGGCFLLDDRRPCHLETHIFQNKICPSEFPHFGYHGRIFRDMLPDDCMVVTNCNQQYLRGAYFVAWTLLRSNGVRLRVYLHDVSPDDPHVQQMQSWGAEIAQQPIDVDPDVTYSMTWNKPAAIADAMLDARRVLWLDSDTSVATSVAEAFDVIERQTFAADHGVYPAINDNDPQVWELLGQPRRRWEKCKYPCAGVIGFRSQRDELLIQEWRDRIAKVINLPDLWNGPNPKLRYYDQGVLQDLLIDDCADGQRWSNFQVRRQGTVAELMQQTYGFDHVICHYGGPQKPWFGWPEILDWPSAS